MAMVVAACLLLEYIVATAAVAVGWNQYVNKLLNNFLGHSLPQALSGAPWDSSPGVVNFPALVLVMMCALLLIRGASESATVNAVMVIIKLGVLIMFAVIAFTAFEADRFASFAPSAQPVSAPQPGRSSSPTSAWTRSPRPATR